MTGPLGHRPIVDLLGAMASSDGIEGARAELEMVQLMKQNEDAQRAGLWVCFTLWQQGSLTYDDYAYRVAEIVRGSLKEGRIRKLFDSSRWRPTVTGFSEMAEVVCVLDMMADAGEPAPMAIVEDDLPSIVRECGRMLRFRPTGEPTRPAAFTYQPTGNFAEDVKAVRAMMEKARIVAENDNVITISRIERVITEPPA